MRPKHYTLYYMGNQVAICSKRRAYFGERVGMWDVPTCDDCLAMLRDTYDGNWAYWDNPVIAESAWNLFREHEL